MCQMKFIYVYFLFVILSMCKRKKKKKSIVKAYSACAQTVHSAERHDYSKDYVSRLNTVQNIIPLFDATQLIQRKRNKQTENIIHQMQQIDQNVSSFKLSKTNNF